MTYIGGQLQTLKDTSTCCAARSWQHHLLASYYHATLAVILAQFSHKGFTDGMAGVIELAEASSYLQASTMHQVAEPICAELYKYKLYDHAAKVG